MATPVTTGPLPIAAIYLLEPMTVDGRGDGALSIARAGATGIVDLVRITFRLDPHRRETARADFDAFAALAADGYIRRLRAPRRWDALDATVHALVADCRSAR